MKKENLGYGIINKTVTAIKAKPDINSSLADEGLFGMVVRLIKAEDNGWYLIETHYKYRGYVHKDDLLIDDERAKLWSEEADHLIICGVVDVMKEPNYKNYSIKLLTRGSFIRVTGNKKNEWIEVMLPEGERGWVREKFISKKKKIDIKENEKILREALIKTACSYLGTQYRWGGKSPLGIDCSGLCSMAYMINGILIWRDAELREEYMKEIKREEIKKGDLLFYKGHVAMYIGRGKVVHSSGSRSGVVINSLNKDDEDYDEYLDKKMVSIGTVFN